MSLRRKPVCRFTKSQVFRQRKRNNIGYIKVRIKINKGISKILPHFSQLKTKKVLPLRQLEQVQTKKI
jgi:hypothetical protein